MDMTEKYLKDNGKRRQMAFLTHMQQGLGKDLSVLLSFALLPPIHVVRFGPRRNKDYYKSLRHEAWAYMGRVRKLERRGGTASEREALAIETLANYVTIGRSYGDQEIPRWADDVKESYVSKSAS